MQIDKNQHILLNIGFKFIHFKLMLVYNSWESLKPLQSKSPEQCYGEESVKNKRCLIYSKK
jgi:hypothetical protein